MRIKFDGGTLLLPDAPNTVPYAEWDDRVNEYRAQAYRYRALLEWAGAWSDHRDANGTDERDGAGDQAPVQQQLTSAASGDSELEDTARAYPDLALEPALRIEPRDYQQAALDVWRDHDRRGSVVLPTGSGKTFLGLQAIADAGVSALVVGTHYRFDEPVARHTHQRLRWTTSRRT